MFDNIKPKSNNKKDRQKGGQQPGKGKVTSQEGSNIYKMIHSQHLLLQKTTSSQKKKGIVKKVSPFMGAKFYHGIMTNNGKEDLV